MAAWRTAIPVSRKALTTGCAAVTLAVGVAMFELDLLVLSRSYQEALSQPLTTQTC